MRTRLRLLATPPGLCLRPVKLPGPPIDPAASGENHRQPRRPKGYCDRDESPGSRSRMRTTPHKSVRGGEEGAAFAHEDLPTVATEAPEGAHCPSSRLSGR